MNRDVSFGKSRPVSSAPACRNTASVDPGDAPGRSSNIPPNAMFALTVCLPSVIEKPLAIRPVGNILAHTAATQSLFAAPAFQEHAAELAAKALAETVTPGRDSGTGPYANWGYYGALTRHLTRIHLSI